MKRFPLEHIAALMMVIIFCNKQAIGAAVPFQQLSANLPNVNLTNQSRVAQKPIFRRHLLNVNDANIDYTNSSYTTSTDANSTDANITHKNCTDERTSYHCPPDKYYFSWAYVGAVVGVATVVLISCAKYFSDRQRRNPYLGGMQMVDYSSGRGINNLYRDWYLNIINQEESPQLLPQLSPQLSPQSSPRSVYQNLLEPIETLLLDMGEIRGVTSNPQSLDHAQLTVRAIPSTAPAGDLDQATVVNIHLPKPDPEATIDHKPH